MSQAAWFQGPFLDWPVKPSRCSQTWPPVTVHSMLIRVLHTWRLSASLSRNGNLESSPPPPPPRPGLLTEQRGLQAALAEGRRRHLIREKARVAGLSPLKEEALGQPHDLGHRNRRGEGGPYL